MTDLSASGSVPGHYDVIVVGSGVGGLASALACVVAGFTVGVFEKDTQLGGGTAWAHGGIWAGCTDVMKRNGLDDSFEAVIDYLRFVGGGATEDTRLQAFVYNAPAAIKFFEACGIELQITHGFPDHYYPMAPGSTACGRSIEPVPFEMKRLGSWAGKVRKSRVDPPLSTVEEYISLGGNNNLEDATIIEERRRDDIRARGSALIAHLLHQLLQRKVAIFTGQGASRLLKDDGRVRGIKLSDGRLVHATRGVILATGGWEGDAQLAGSFEGVPGWRTMFPKAVSGDGYRMATEVGAASTIISNNLALFLGFDVPLSDEEEEVEFRLSSVYELMCPHTIVVNRAGKRFGDETYFQQMAVELRKFDIWDRTFVNLPCWLIFDSQYAENYSFCGTRRGSPLPQWVQRADTLEQLANKLGIDARGLANEVERFNTFAKQGNDSDFCRGERSWTLAKHEALRGGNSRNRTLGSLERGPFYAMKLSPSAFASGGIRARETGEVEDSFGQPIAGLFGVGNVTAHLEYGIGYQAGLSLASGLTFGYLCANHLKRELDGR